MTDHKIQEEETEPKDSMEWFRLAKKQRADGNPEEAVKSAFKALKSSPKLKAAWSFLEDIYDQIGDRRQAEKAGKKALELDAEFTKLSRHFRVGFIDAAYPELSRTDTIKALQIDPTCAEAWFFLGTLHVDIPAVKRMSTQPKDYQNALEAFQKAVQIDPEHARAWSYMGWLCLNQGNQKKAVELIRKSLEMNPDSADSWCSLGMAYLSAGDSSAAIDACSKALSINPGHYEAWGQKAAAHLVLKQYSEARQAYLSSLQIEPMQPRVRNMLAVTYESNNQFDEAIEVYKEAVEVETFAANKQFFLHKTGLLYGCLKQHKKAIEYFQRALVINREDSEAWHNLGAAYYENGQFNKSVQAFEKSLKIRPNSKITENALDKVRRHMKLTSGRSS